MLKLTTILLIFASAGLLAMQLVPLIVEKIHNLQEKRAKQLSRKMENIFLRTQMSHLILFYTVLPVVLAFLGFSIFHKNLIATLGGIILGLLLPGAWVRSLESSRKRKFHKQLIDSLLILSSSLKGGLSLVQAIAVMVEEMPPPISQEFGALLNENKMGMPLEKSFAILAQRMPSVELEQMISAILLARETGGNLPFIFARLVNSIRENTKINQNVSNLTIQGRIQGLVMVALPIVFGAVVTAFNPGYFNIMLGSEIGRFLLIYAVFSELIGLVLIRKISSVKL